MRAVLCLRCIKYAKPREHSRLRHVREVGHAHRKGVPASPGCCGNDVKNLTLSATDITSGANWQKYTIGMCKRNGIEFVSLFPR